MGDDRFFFSTLISSLLGLLNGLGNGGDENLGRWKLCLGLRFCDGGLVMKLSVVWEDRA